MKSLNKHAKWRFEVAKKFFSKIERSDKLVAFFVGGSVSRNFADEFSDLEICFVWKTEISEEERSSLYKQIGFKEIKLNIIKDNSNPFEDTLYLEKLQIDIWHLTENNINNTINDVLLNFETSISKSNLLETFQSCIPIFGNEYIFSLREQIEIFPNVLAENIIKQYTKDFFRIDIEMFIERKDWIVVYRYIPTFLRLLILVFDGLNKKYHLNLGFKKLHKSLDRYKILPKNTLYVYSNLDKMNPTQAWSEVVRLKTETLELVNIHYPNIHLDFIEKNKTHNRTKFSL